MARRDVRRSQLATVLSIKCRRNSLEHCVCLADQHLWSHDKEAHPAGRTSIGLLSLLLVWHELSRLAGSVDRYGSKWLQLLNPSCLRRRLVYLTSYRGRKHTDDTADVSYLSVLSGFAFRIPRSQHHALRCLGSPVVACASTPLTLDQTPAAAERR
ncbi:hypothetical protein BKA56DRAFT_620027 [Ilyonectria sp. MPI-CAGE-AT-0026]|nr:hypothetical protein BKA56DRAFT_620027 [Ilyonectria sp. MPI-CAGE-AT-0026]